MDALHQATARDSALAWRSRPGLVLATCLLTAAIANEVVGPVVHPPSAEAVPSAANREVTLDGFSDAPALAPPSVDHGESSLPFALLGTFASTEPALSQATLLDRERAKTLVVGVGHHVRDGVLVAGIERGRVVLRVNGEPRELTLAVSSAHRADAIPDSMLVGAHVLPVFEEDRVVGLRFGLVQYGSHFEEIGFETGDVVTEINGTPVDDPDRIAQLLEELSEADAAYAIGYRADGSERIWDYVRADG